MEGIHDLGGKQGFGPVDAAHGDAPWHHAWELRMWALSRAGLAKGITIDWFRHGIERMVPGDYLTFPYFEKWCTLYLMFLVDDGTITVEQAVSGHVEQPAAGAAPKTLADILAANRAACRSFAAETSAAPLFAAGDAVVTRRLMHDGHTRLPAYARSARGKVIACHGGHLLPDAGAKGVETAEHLYTVAFTAIELWGAGADRRDTVMLDLWESYLAPA